MAEINGVSSADVASNSARFSEQSSLRKVLRQELGENSISCHNLLVTAVHAVLLDSGFVRLDQTQQLHLAEKCPSVSSAFTKSISYTLPEILGQDKGSIVLKFETVNLFFNVSGSLDKNGSRVHRLRLNKNAFAPNIYMMMGETENNECACYENEVSEFWRIVKDGVCFPLLIDLCEMAGLSLPSCFMILPADTKTSILKLLPGVSIARMECVSSEMWHLSSDDDELWRHKFREEFGSEAETDLAAGNWKSRFASQVELSKKRRTRLPRLVSLSEYVYARYPGLSAMT
ncbi:Putative F-box protein At1g23770 [Linum grandiflorum]